jgi:hypothetical protein
MASCNHVNHPSNPIVDPSTGNCPSYTHKDDASIGNVISLPEGFFVFDRDTIPGLYKSLVLNYNASLIPNTEHDYPRTISISDDGKWVLYANGYSGILYLMQVNGCGKTIVPVTNISSGPPGWPPITGFYRRSPYGCEIFYLASTRQIHSVRVDLSSVPPQFSADRVIADIGDSLQFDPNQTLQIAVNRDQIFCDIDPVINGVAMGRTGYLTIPADGTGIGTAANVFKWINDDYKTIDGCGHTMSFDGQYCLANPGGIFASDCVPGGAHKGFYITPFRRDSDPPINLYTQDILVFGTSINWCPALYRENDENFWGWYFSNNNTYVAGRMISGTTNCGAWVVDWQRNIWTPITPLDSNISIMQPAIYFGPVDTGFAYTNPTCESSIDTSINPNFDMLNPLYRIIQPNGGEAFSIGQPCTVRVTSVRPGKGMLKLSISGGKIQTLLPGFLASINPQTDSLFVFQIPDSIEAGGQNYSTISQQCKILIVDYSNPSYQDASDQYFEIRR